MLRLLVFLKLIFEALPKLFLAGPVRLRFVCAMIENILLFGQRRPGGLLAGRPMR